MIRESPGILRERIRSVTDPAKGVEER